jgi:hypothetical protein
MPATIPPIKAKGIVNDLGASTPRGKTRKPSMLQ